MYEALSGRATAVGATPDAMSARLAVVVDASLPDWEVLANDVAPNAEVIALEQGLDGLTQLVDLLAGQSTDLTKIGNRQVIADTITGDTIAFASTAGVERASQFAIRKSLACGSRETFDLTLCSPDRPSTASKSLMRAAASTGSIFGAMAMTRGDE